MHLFEFVCYIVVTLSTNWDLQYNDGTVTESLNSVIEFDTALYYNALMYA